MGGETSELSDIIKENLFDIAGFAVGMVKNEKIISSDNVKRGDLLIALKSSGPHANGYTLIRKLYENKEISEDIFTKTLEPSYIYVDEILKLNEHSLIRSCANITGGGIKANTMRVISNELSLDIDFSQILLSDVFESLKSSVGFDEAFNVFNMGVGMVIVASERNKNAIFEICSKFSPFVIGKVI
ncbi:MAG: AIR synthase-related protein [Candidatus Gastranaerophilales bacterium]|nr:AIR synthase-related protein [Candidatus Gastranaerophilales bacterium]